jgi:hypothetical protein
MTGRAEGLADMDKPLGPLRAFRDRYVAGYGGVSYDLAPRAIGVHPGALAMAPELPGRRVLVQAEDAHRLPLHRRPAFTVVVLDHLMRNARELAQRGGVVFSSFDLDDPAVASLLANVDLGDPLYLNASLERLPDVFVRRPGDRPAA